MLNNQTLKNFWSKIIVFIHHGNIQRFAIQMYMVANGMSADIMSEILQLRENTHYLRRHTWQFLAHPIHNIYTGSDSESSLGPKIWKLIAPEIKRLNLLAKCSGENNKWKPNDYPFRLCKVFISYIGFI